MKTCHIYPVATVGGGYQWRWRSTDGRHKSSSARAFELFYDCVEDARNHGAEIDLDTAHRDIADANITAKTGAESSRA